MILNHHARNTVFTVLDFEYFYDDPNPTQAEIIVRRFTLVLRIDYYSRSILTHELEEVYKLHDNAAISSLVVSSGFCITGGEDQLLRVADGFR